MAKRVTLDEMGIGLGKRTRLHRLLYEHGPANGTLLLLPIDQGMEHGPVDFFPNPASADPDYQCRLAEQGGYSGIVFHTGLVEKYMRDYAGTVPLVHKINGKTAIPPDDEAFSPLEATVEDAVQLGADAIGYTLYVGSSSQDRDFIQFGNVRREAERYGMPVVVWSYPRGRAIEAKGGRDSIYAVDYAARLACELGADVVKLNVPKFDNPGNLDSPAAIPGSVSGLAGTGRGRSLPAGGREGREFCGPDNGVVLRREPHQRRRSAESRHATVWRLGPLA